MSSKKITPKTIWLEQGLKILASQGPGFLSIDNMALSAGKTKGSFYHHFRSREHFIEELLDYYEKTTTHEVILVASEDAEPRSRLKRLTELAFRISSSLELAIRAWALYEPAVKRFQDRIDRQRLEYLKGLYLASFGESAKASTLAYRNYSLFIGLQQLKHHHSQKEFQNLLKDIFFDLG